MRDSNSAIILHCKRGAGFELSARPRELFRLSSARGDSNFVALLMKRAGRSECPAQIRHYLRMNPALKRHAIRLTSPSRLSQPTLCWDTPPPRKQPVESLWLHLNRRQIDFGLRVASIRQNAVTKVNQFPRRAFTGDTPVKLCSVPGVNPCAKTMRW